MKIFFVHVKLIYRIRDYRGGYNRVRIDKWEPQNFTHLDCVSKIQNVFYWRYQLCFWNYIIIIRCLSICNKSYAQDGLYTDSLLVEKYVSLEPIKFALTTQCEGSLCPYIEEKTFLHSKTEYPKSLRMRNVLLDEWIRYQLCCGSSFVRIRLKASENDWSSGAFRIWLQ